MREHKIILLILLLFFISSACAQIALVPEDTSKNIEGLKTEFKLGLVNLDDARRNISIESNATKGLNISHTSKLALKPAGGRENSESGRWYRVSRGKYAKIHYIDISVSIDPKSGSRRHSFSVNVKTFTDPEIERPRLEEVRQINYDLFSSSSKIKAGFEPEPGFSTNQNQSQEQNKPTNLSEQEDKNQTSSAKKVSPMGNERIDNVTLLLLLAIIITSWYVISEAI